MSHRRKINSFSVDVFDIPEEAGKYITAVLEGTEPLYGRATVKFEFLSDFTMHMVRKATRTDSHVRALDNIGVKKIIAEHVARQYFKGEWDHEGTRIPLVPDLNLNYYDVCIDVGCDGVIDARRNVENKSALMKLLPRWEQKAVFCGMYLDKDVKLLNQGFLYRALSHNFALGDAVVVDHEEKKIFFIKLTAQDVAAYVVKLSTLETVMAKLRLLDGGENDDYTLWIVFYTDWSRVQTHGCCFATTVDSLRKIEVEKFTAECSATDASSDEKSRAKAAGGKLVKFYKHSCIAEDGKINCDDFKLSGSKKGWRQPFKREDLSQYLSPIELAIMKRCHVLIVRCDFISKLMKD